MKKSWLEVMKENLRQRRIKNLTLDAKSRGLKVDDADLMVKRYYEDLLYGLLLLAMVSIFIYLVGFWDGITLMIR